MRTKEQKAQDMMIYLEKTSKHIFKNGKGEFFALVKNAEGTYDAHFSTQIEPVKWEAISRYLKYYESDPVAYVKNYFFPQSNSDDKLLGKRSVKRSKVDSAFLEKIGRSFLKIEKPVEELVEA